MSSQFMCVDRISRFLLLEVNIPIISIYYVFFIHLDPFPLVAVGSAIVMNMEVQLSLKHLDFILSVLTEGSYGSSIFFLFKF